jgi:hypothetical protein
LGIKDHAKQSVCVSVNTWPSRVTKESRSSSSQKIFRRSIPRTMIWCSAPAACVFAKATPAQVNSGFSWHVCSNIRKTPFCQSIYQYPSPIYHNFAQPGPARRSAAKIPLPRLEPGVIPDLLSLKLQCKILIKNFFRKGAGAQKGAMGAGGPPADILIFLVLFGFSPHQAGRIIFFVLLDFI